mmetsp:Transcript_14889/g.34834  ORF Transcript_14889/g.34834 Transcript_14889/m.34834 type:complete len:163 (+) Transcript_14889:687-1175(+)
MGKPALTWLRVLAHAERDGWKYSLVLARIRTGRRHQIRTHLHHVGHPTVADGKYTRAAIFTSDLAWCPRNFLHRQRLAFHDASGEPREAVEPLPTDLRGALRSLTACGPRSHEALREWIGGARPRAWTEYEPLPENGWEASVAATAAASARGRLQNPPVEVS